MAEAQKVYTYQLKPNLPIDRVIDLLSKINKGSTIEGTKILADLFVSETVPSVSENVFSITLNPEEFSDPEKINPYQLKNILFGITSFISYYARTNKKNDLIPLLNSDEGAIFYLRGRYGFPDVRPDQATIKIITATQENVARRLLPQVTQDQLKRTTDTFNIYELNEEIYRDLLENWPKVAGIVRELIALPKEASVISLKNVTAFAGTTFADKNYTIQSTPILLNEYFKRVIVFVKEHKNFNQPEASDKKVLDNLVKAEGKIPFNEQIIDFNQGTKENVYGVDNKGLKDYLELIAPALQIIKNKDVKAQAAVGAEADEVEGAEGEEPKQFIAYKKITVEQLTQFVTDRLIPEIYNRYFADRVSNIDEEAELIRKWVLRNFLLKKISDSVKLKNANPEFSFLIGGVQSQIDIKQYILLEINEGGSLYELYEDGYFEFNDQVENWIQFFVETAVANFSDEATRDRVYQETLDFFKKSQKIREEAPKPDLPQVTNQALIPFLARQSWSDDAGNQLYEGFDWKNSTEDERVAYFNERKIDFLRNVWGKLSLEERRKFLEQSGFLVYLETYSESLAEEFLREHLAQNGIIDYDKEDFAPLLDQFRQNVFDNLINVPPNDFKPNSTAFFSANADISQTIKSNLRTEYSGTLSAQINQVIVTKPHLLIPELESKPEQTDEELLAQVDPTLIKNYSKFVLNDLYRIYQVDPSQGLDPLLLQTIEAELQIFLQNNPKAIYLLEQSAYREVFINAFLDKRGSFFRPTVENEVSMIERERLLNQISSEAGEEDNPPFRFNIDNTVHAVFTQAAMSQTDPLEYFNSLTNQELKDLFNLPFDVNDEEKFAQFRKLMIKYIKRSVKPLGLDKIVDEKKEVNKEEFTTEVAEYRNLARTISPQTGGQQLYQIVTIPAAQQPVIEEVPAGLSETETRQIEDVKNELQTRKSIALAILRDLEIQEQAAQQGVTPDQLSISQWSQALNEAPTEQSSRGFGRFLGRGKKKKSIQSRMMRKGISKTMSAATTATGAIGNYFLPGAGAVAATINALPIKDEYKQALQTGFIGGTVGVIGGGIYLYTNTIGGFVGGTLGGIAGGTIGFLTGGPAGIIPGAATGWLTGTYTGWIISQNFNAGSLLGGGAGAVGGFFIGGPIGAVIGATLGSAIGTYLWGLAEKAAEATGLASPINAAASGASKAASGLWNAGKSLFGGGGGAASTGQGGAILSSLPSIPTGTFAATATTMLGMPVMFSTLNHNAFLQDVPTVDPSSEDISRYVALEKEAVDGTKFDDPQAVTYRLSITPREGYNIILTAPPEDEFTISCNTETRDEETCPNVGDSVFEEHRGFSLGLADLQDQVILDGETLEIGLYTVNFADSSSNFDDASIENRFSITFNVIENGTETKTNETAVTTQKICFGECPTLQEGCWPTDGVIRQVPYNPGFTHRIVDAIDISNSSSPNIYSSTDGEACFFSYGSGITYSFNLSSLNSEQRAAYDRATPSQQAAIRLKHTNPYGNHVMVKSGSFALLYGHFATMTQDEGCTPVTAGTKLGIMGTTGNSTGIHLHWEIRTLGNGFLGYTSQIAGQSFGMPGQTLLEQHAPIEGKTPLNEDVETCYE